MRRFLTTLASLLVLALHSPAVPMGTAFTFQGRLNSSFPANGAVSMTFSLWDDATGGRNVGVPTTRVLNALVVDWVFTVDLDFGGSAFAGEARWLETRVNGAASGPRIRVAPTPHAIHASTATTATTVAAASVQVSGLATAGGSPAAGQILGYNGSSMIWQDPVSSGAWRTSGDNLYYTQGHIGIGLASPSYPLHVAGGARLDRLEVSQSLRVLGGVLTTPNAEFIVEDKFSGLGSLAPRFIVKEDGKSGFGTSNPQAVLHVNGYWDRGRPALQLSGQKPSIILAGDTFSGNRSWLMHLGGNGPGNLEFLSRTGDGGWTSALSLSSDSSFLRVQGAGGEQAYLGGDGIGNDIQVGSLNPAVTDIFMYNAASGRHMHTHVGVLTIHGGSDLAEPFPMKEQEIEPGSVVVIDHEHPGRLKQSTRAYDTRVAGIVSGANGINPGIALKQEGVLDQGRNVALSGRVYVRADASHGRIQPGDLLTTSDTPGHAMRVEDHSRSQGAILGKAMSSLDRATGLVLVLVSLQ